jgi:hypothetical protein
MEGSYDTEDGHNNNNYYEMSANTDGYYIDNSGDMLEEYCIEE